MELYAPLAVTLLVVLMLQAVWVTQTALDIATDPLSTVAGEVLRD
jgi:hypothetical protein